MPWCVVENFYLWYCVESVIVCHEVTDALAEVTGLDADTPQEGAACPSSHDNDFHTGTLWKADFHGKTWPNGVGAHLFVWKSQFLFAKGTCAWPQGFDCHVKSDCCFLMLYPDHVHWCVMCCYWVRVQSDDDFRPDEHRSEGCGCPLLCHCGVFDPVFLFASYWGYLIGHMEDPTTLWNFVVFSVKTYTLFLKDACAFPLSFKSCWVLAGSHAKEKCACDQLANGCVQMCVCPPVDVKD